MRRKRPPERRDPARQVAFERASRRPEQVDSLFYDSRANLVAAGVIGYGWKWLHG